MEKIPIFSKNENLLEDLSGLVPKDLTEKFEFLRLENVVETIDFLNIETPSFIVLDFTGECQTSIELLHTLRSDPWLLACGIVAIYDQPSFFKEVPAISRANLIAGLAQSQVKKFFPQVLRIINDNRQFLFQRFIAQDLSSPVSGSFVVPNNLVAGTCFGNLIVNFLYNLHRINDEMKFSLGLILQELLVNAVEHGNCMVTKEEKAQWLNNGQEIHALLERRLQDPEIAGRSVTFDYQISNDFSTFQISDQGTGFDWRRHFVEVQKENMELCGRGLSIAKNFFPDLKFNEAGNQVSFRVDHKQDQANTAPGLFSNQEALDFSPGEVIFFQGERSDHLYYIMKGTFTVEVNGKEVARLQRDDIFMGEMSFLLKNHRTATIKALSPGCLTRISKKDFIEAIREKPQYGLFLCRLMAERIARLNVQMY